MTAITSDNPMKPILVKYYRDKWNAMPLLNDKSLRVNCLSYNKKENYYSADILFYEGNGKWEVVMRGSRVEFDKFNWNLLSYKSSKDEKWRLWGVGFYSKKNGGDGLSHKHPDLPDKYWK